MEVSVHSWPRLASECEVRGLHSSSKQGLMATALMVEASQCPWHGESDQDDGGELNALVAKAGI